MFLHTDLFTHRHFYTQTFLHTDPFTHTHAFAHRPFYTQTLLHTNTFTHRPFYTQTALHRNTFTHRRLYTQTFFFHTDPFTHKHLYTEMFLHTDPFTHRHFYTQTLLHTHTRFSHRPKSSALRPDVSCNFLRSYLQSVASILEHVSLAIRFGSSMWNARDHLVMYIEHQSKQLLLSKTMLRRHLKPSQRLLHALVALGWSKANEKDS